MAEHDDAHWTSLHGILARQVDWLRSGKMKTFTGPQLETDTSAESLRVAEQSLAAVERLLARRGLNA